MDDQPSTAHDGFRVYAEAMGTEPAVREATMEDLETIVRFNRCDDKVQHAPLNVRAKPVSDRVRVSSHSILQSSCSPAFFALQQQ